MLLWSESSPTSKMLETRRTICVFWVPRVKVPPSTLPLLRSGSRGPTSLTTDLAAHSFSPSCACLLFLQKKNTITVSLTVEPPNAAGDSSQPVPWSCQPVSKYATRIPVSTTPEDVTNSAIVPTSSHQDSSNNGLTNNTLHRYHEAIIFSCNGANEFESGCKDDMKCACTVKVNCALPIDKVQDAHAMQLRLGQEKSTSGLGIGSNMKRK